MKSILKIGYSEIEALLKNRSLLIFAVLLPFLFMLFFNRLLTAGVARDLPIAVVDYDHSKTSRTVISNLSATPQVDVKYREGSRQDAETLVKEGKAYGMVIIPKDFERDIRLNRPVQVINEFNGSLLLSGGLENSGVRRAVGAISAGIQMKSQLAKNKTMDRARIDISPVLLDTHILSNPFLNYSYYLNSGFLNLFLIIFLMLTTVYVLGTDFKYNRGKELFEKANQNVWYVLLGKLWPYTLWFYVLGLITYYSMFVFQDFQLKGSKFLLLVALFLAIISVQALAVLLVARSSSLRDALNKGSSLAALSMAFSGFTFPVFAMPKLIQWLAQVFPFTHYLDIFLDQTQRGYPVIYSLKAVVILIVLTIFFITLGAIKYKKLLHKGAYATTI